MLLTPSLAHAQSWSSCTAYSSCIFTNLQVSPDGGANFDGTIPDIGRNWIVRAFVTPGFTVDVGDVNEINRYNYYRDGMGGVYTAVDFAPHTFTGPSYVRGLSTADWDVYDYYFVPGSHPFYTCDTPGPADSKCGEYTDWWWNSAGLSVSGPGEFANVRIGLIAVPEPASWAMLIIGFGLVGGVLRQRSRSGAPAVA